MCTVLLRFAPGSAWPLLLAAVRDEFVDRAWDPPGRYWGDQVLGGRDRTAGGTWLAVDPVRPGVAAVLNGVRLPHPAQGERPTRGTLPLDALRGREPEGAGYDGFHLIRATPHEVQVWSWDGRELVSRSLEPGDHIIVNRGVGHDDVPVVAHFLPLLRTAAGPDSTAAGSTVDFWGDWVRLLGGDRLDPGDPRALLVGRSVAGKNYASTSASLVALRDDRVRYDFCAAPVGPSGWFPVWPDGQPD
ncbi:MAG TPA: NRDE family protein [Rugosimonospora sp.]